MHPTQSHTHTGYTSPLSQTDMDCTENKISLWLIRQTESLQQEPFGVFERSFSCLTTFSPFHISILRTVSRTTLCAWPIRGGACWLVPTWFCRAQRAPSTRRPKSGGYRPSPCAGCWSLPGRAGRQKRGDTWWICPVLQVSLPRYQTLLEWI